MGGGATDANGGVGASGTIGQTVEALGVGGEGVCGAFLDAVPNVEVRG